MSYESQKRHGGDKRMKTATITLGRYGTEINLKGAKFLIGNQLFPSIEVTGKAEEKLWQTLSIDFTNGHIQALNLTKIKGALERILDVEIIYEREVRE